MTFQQTTWNFLVDTRKFTERPLPLPLGGQHCLNNALLALANKFLHSLFSCPLSAFKKLSFGLLSGVPLYLLPDS